LPVGASSVTTLVSTGLNHPSGIAVDSAGNLYIADSGNNAIKELAVGSQTLTTILASGLNSPQGITIDSAGNLYVADTGNNEIKEIIHRSYFFNTAPNIEKPVIISDLWENTSQIQLSKAVFTALAGQGVINSTNFSNATSPESPTDYLYYNAGTGGLYYAADGSNLGKSPVEIAIIGVDSHPAALSPGDFKLIG